MTFPSSGFFDGAAGDASDVNLLLTLERGWAFASVEYRQVPQVTLDDAISDVQAACEWIRNGKLDEALGGGQVDGERLAVTGASAGELYLLFLPPNLLPTLSIYSPFYCCFLRFFPPR
jgi:acetyl esterase/lipase